MATIIVGAGPAGLAVAGCLRQRGLPFVILERAPKVGWSWRNHYRRLRLHTARDHSTLPGMGWPDGVPVYPSRQQVVDYLEAYAERFDIRPALGAEVTQIVREGGRWSVATTDGEHVEDRVVVATGYNRVPHQPTWPGMDSFSGSVIHTRDYRTADAYRGKRVLVVGAGNTGAEIAIDLWEQGARPLLCIRGPLHVVPRDSMGIPGQVHAIAMSRLPLAIQDRLALLNSSWRYRDLAAYGIHRPAVGPMTSIAKLGRVPLLDVGTIDLIRQGAIEVVPGIERFTASGVTCADGGEHACDDVILATGYRPQLQEFMPEVDGLLDERGYPRVRAAEAQPGLYFVGFSNPPTGFLRGIARDAVRVAEHIGAAA